MIDDTLNIVLDPLFNHSYENAPKYRSNFYLADKLFAEYGH
jgi:hypothetical protein